MLPQKAGIKSFSKPIRSFPEQDSHEAGRQYATLGQSHAPAVSHAAQDKAANMLPPSKSLLDTVNRPAASLGRTNSSRDYTKIGHLPRQPSTSRKSSKDSSTNVAYASQKMSGLSHPRPEVRISSRGSNPQTNPKVYGRSSSQQVRLTGTTDPPPSKGLPQRKLPTRPAFSAMQQHFTPKKNTQPDPTTLASKDEIPSADIFHLQMELAQLHLLHRSSLFVQEQWEKSAKVSFEHRFSALYERHTELREVAHQQQTLINQLSLVEWSQGRSGAQIAEKVQLLSHNVSETRNILDSEGRYTHILEIFESWFAQALRVRDRRENHGQVIGRDLDFIEGIGDGWKAEAMVLERELTYFARDLDSFGEVQETSSLCRIISMYRKLMVGLLEELDIIQWIENEIITQETLWIESTIHNLASNVSNDICSMAPVRKAV